MTGLVQKATALFLGIISSTALLIMFRYQSRTVFFVVTSIVLCFLIVAAFSFRRIAEVRWHLLPLLLTTVLSCIGLSTVMEWDLWRFFLAGFVGAAVALLFGWSVTDGVVGLTHKPFRRMKMMLWVFDAYAIVTIFFALGVFFPEVPVWIFQLATGLLLSGISYMIWRMYYEAGIRELLIWMLIIGIVMIELVWAVQLLPFGYLVSGLLVTWLWYILQLLLRFHIGPEDVVWGRQRRFLLTNALLFAITLYLARWV